MTDQECFDMAMRFAFDMAHLQETDENAFSERVVALIREAEARGEQRGRIAELELWISQNWSPYNNSRFRARIAELEAK